VKEVTMKLLIILSLVMLAGCIPSWNAVPPSDVPQLISMSSLPVCPGLASALEIRIEVIFQVRRDGSIADALIVRSSGDADWDSVAAHAMKQWRFTPITSLDDSSTLSLRSTVRVRPEEQASFALGALVASTQAEADSLSAILEAGTSFDSLARSHRLGEPVPRGRYFGVTDIGTFPYQIRSKLRALRPDGVTHPLQLGTEYVIFKRFAEVR
jgi:TonB family protein